MLKKLKYIVYGLVGLLIILVVAPFFISVDSYKQPIINKIQDVTGKKVSIDGDIKLSLLPHPTVTVKGVKISSPDNNKDSTSIFLEVDTISASIPISALIDRKLSLSGVNLVEPKLKIKVQNAASTSRSVPVSAKLSPFGVLFAINDLSIKHGILQYVNDKDNIIAEDINLTMNSSNLQSSINLAVNNITKGDYVLGNLTSKINIKDDNLNISSLTADLLSGKLNLSGNISLSEDKSSNFKVSLNEFEITNIMPKNNRIKITQGKFNLVTNLQSHGSDFDTYIGSLNGDVNLNSVSVKLSGIDVQKIVDSLKTKDVELLLGLVNAAFSQGNTNIDKIQAIAKINNGVMQLEQCTLNIAGASANASGKINLASQLVNINYVIDPNLKDIPTLSANISGPISNLKNRINVDEIQKNLAGKIIHNVIEDLKNGGIENKIKNIFKGIGI